MRRFGLYLVGWLALLGALTPQQVSAIAADTTRTSRQVQQLIRQGNEAVQRGDYPTATALGQRALQLSQQPPGFLRGQLRAMELLAEVDFYCEDLPNAIRWMREAVRVADAMGDLELRVTTYDHLGNCLSESQQYQEADRWLQRAREGHRQLHDLGDESLTLVNLAANEMYQGHLAAAQTFIEEAIHLAWQQPDSGLVSNALINRARLFAEQGKHAAAIADGERALRIVEKTGHTENILTVLNSMPELYERAGKYRQALTSQRRAAFLRDSLNSLEVRHRLAELNTRFRVEQQQTRIRALTQERRIVQLQAQQERVRARIWSMAAVLLAILLAVGAWLYRQLRRQREQLATSEAALRQANQTKDQLMSIIGHDLRSPMAGFQQVGLVLRAMAKAPDPEDMQALAAELDASSSEMSALLDNLLHWGRAQTGQARAFPQATDVRAVIAGVGKLLGPVAQKKGVTFQTAMLSTLPEARTDAALLAVVLRNLVSNAIKFTPAGGTVTVTVEPMSNGQLALQVQDTGVGLSPERLAQLLASTGGAPASTPGTAGEPGTGLGLAVVRHFVSLLGSNLLLTSTPGVGTTASFRLPTV